MRYVGLDAHLRQSTICVLGFSCITMELMLVPSVSPAVLTQ